MEAWCLFARTSGRNLPQDCGTIGRSVRAARKLDVRVRLL